MLTLPGLADVLYSLASDTDDAIEMYEIGTHVIDNSRQGRAGRVVAISRSDSMCIVEYADNRIPHTSGWALMEQFKEAGK